VWPGARGAVGGAVVHALEDAVDGLAQAAATDRACRARRSGTCAGAGLEAHALASPGATLDPRVARGSLGEACTAAAAFEIARPGAPLSEEHVGGRAAVAAGAQLDVLSHTARAEGDRHAEREGTEGAKSVRRARGHRPHSVARSVHRFSYFSRAPQKRRAPMTKLAETWTGESSRTGSPATR
jgi:hypothetical protein